MERTIKQFAREMTVATNPEIIKEKTQNMRLSLKRLSQKVPHMEAIFTREVGAATLLDIFHHVEGLSDELKKQLADQFQFTEGVHYDRADYVGSHHSAEQKQARAKNIGYWEALSSDDLMTKAFGRIRADGLVETFMHRVGGDK